MNEAIEKYISELSQQYQTGNAREHAYRPALKNLIEALLPKGYTVVNEPRHIECGAPDFMLMHKDLPVAYAEAKDIGDSDLEGKAKNKEQFTRYKQSLSSLFFTDYLTFHFYHGGEPVTTIQLAKIENGKIVGMHSSSSAVSSEGILSFTSEDSETHFIQTLREWAAAKPQLITSPKRLAERMASKAKLLAHTIEQSLLDDKKNEYQVTPLWLQLNAFKQALVSDLDEHRFADLYAQTIAYGLFAARLNDKSPDDFTRHEAATLIPRTNPFLRDAFQHIAGYNIDPRIAWIVDDLVETFAATNMQKVMRGFKRDTRQTDPILHFYEDFLRAYDPKQKKQAGVYYTPEPVVDFIVRAVDDILKTDFHLPKGLADISKTDVQIQQEENAKMVTHIENLHRVQILDPATGTGTFLAAIVRHIKSTMENNMGAWNQYVVQHLLPRLYGFELMMAPYTIAHLKMDIEMNSSEGFLSLTPNTLTPNTLTPTDRVRIFLTNSLERNSIIEKTALGSIIAREANEANLIKHNAPIMIVMGNPPYSVSSSNKSEFIQGLLEDYKKSLNEKNIQPLSDDYIKFIRLAQHYVEKNGEGIVAYISNNSFIDGLIHRQMRAELMRTFDKIYILDLHGNTRKKETAPDGSKDENVFDIMQGVSINIFVKNSSEGILSLTHGSEGIPSLTHGSEGIPSLTPNSNDVKHRNASLLHYSLYGTRKEKYAFLLSNDLTTVPWQQLTPQAPQFFFVPKDFSLQEEYNKGFKIDELFKVFSSGIETGRDEIFIGNSKEEVAKKVKEIINNPTILKEKYGVNENSSFRILEHIKQVQYSENNIHEVIYRPFNKQYIYYDKELLRRPFYEVMRHFLHSDYRDSIGIAKGYNVGTHSSPSAAQSQPAATEDGRVPNSNGCAMDGLPLGCGNIGLIATRQFGGGKHFIVLCTNKLMERASQPFAPYNVFPLYLYSSASDGLFAESAPQVNMDAEIVERIALVVRDSYPSPQSSKNSDNVKDGNPSLLSLAIFDYIYGILHSPTYRERYKEFLKVDFPRIPYPKNRNEFKHYRSYGEQLRLLHLMDEPTMLNLEQKYHGIATFNVAGSNVVEQVVVKDSYPSHSEEKDSLTTNNSYPSHDNNMTDGNPSLLINPTQRFDNVPKEAWDLYIGGYQPAQKWLKDRRGRTLTFDDITHYRHIIMIYYCPLNAHNRSQLFD